jgi:hypothetical protein
MKHLIIITLLFLFGCGSSTVTVTYNEVSKTEIKAMCIPRDCTGYAEWNFAMATCTIYMMSKQSYRDIDRYHEVLGHEMRHCLEGAWHE